MRKTYSFSVRTCVSWLPLACAVTLLSGLVSVAVQQDMRISANDPQIQMAEDAARWISNGREPGAFVIPDVPPVDIAESLAPFLAVYDDAGNLIASSGVLHGQPLAVPSGVFDYVRNHTEDRVTWQPERGVRSAIVVTRFTGMHAGFVVAGRSLREVEIRERRLTVQVVLTWLVSLAALFGVAVALEWLKS